jgi:hypothetical protein
MLYKVLADIVVLVHFLWILFLVFGAFFGIKNRVVKIVHISGLVFAFILHIFNWYCPLTHIEVWLRARHNPALTYTGSFIAHYAERLIYIDLSPFGLLLLTVFLCGFNAWFYLRKRQ